MYLRYLVLLVLVQLAHASLAQKEDSLQKVLDTARNEFKVKALNESFRFWLPSDPVKAVGYSREAMALAQEIGDAKGLAAAYNNLGIVYRNQGALDKALTYYFQSLNLYDSIKNEEGLATTRNNISTVYSIKRDYPTSMKYLQESYDGFARIGDTVRLAGSLNNIGNLYSDLGEYDKATEFLNKAAELSKTKDLLFADPQTNLGNIYFRQEKYDLADKEYKEAIEIERKSNNRLGVLNLLVNLSINSVKSGKTAEADLFLKEGFQLCETLQAYSMLPALFRAESENYAKKGLFKEAYLSQLKYDEARERIFSEESTRKIAQMEMLMAIQEKEKEYEILRKEDEIKTLELHKSQLFIISVILAVIITLGVLNYMYLSKKKIIKKKKVN